MIVWILEILVHSESQNDISNTVAESRAALKKLLLFIVVVLKFLKYTSELKFCGFFEILL